MQAATQQAPNDLLSKQQSERLPTYRRPADRLPPVARERFNNLRFLSQEAAAASREIYGREQELREELLRIENRKTQLVDRARASWMPDDSALIAESDNEADTKSQLSILRGRLDKIAVRREQSMQLFSKLEHWLFNLRPEIEISSCDGKPAKLRAGEKALDAIERCRRQVRELRTELSAVHAAPWPSAEVKKRARAELAEFAARGRPDVAAAIAQGEKIGWPTTYDIFRGGVVGSTANTFVQADFVDTLGLFTWIHHDALAAALDREIDQRADDEHALTDEQRSQRIKKILSDLLATEREEEDFIQLANEMGADVLRRADADPRAVLGLSSDLPYKKNFADA